MPAVWSGGTLIEVCVIQRVRLGGACGPPPPFVAPLVPRCPLRAAHAALRGRLHSLPGRPPRRANALPAHRDGIASLLKRRRPTGVATRKTYCSYLELVVVRLRLPPTG